MSWVWRGDKEWKKLFHTQKKKQKYESSCQTLKLHFALFIKKILLLLFSMGMFTPRSSYSLRIFPLTLLFFFYPPKWKNTRRKKKLKKYLFLMIILVKCTSMHRDSQAPLKIFSHTVLISYFICILCDIFFLLLRCTFNVYMGVIIFH